MRKSVHEHDAAAAAHGPAHRQADAGPHQQQQHPLAPATPTSLLHLQRTAGNQAVVQRVKDAFGVKLANTDLQLAGAFKDKHVATDKDDAIAATKWRFDNGKMPMPMQRGTMANTVATSETWVDALDASSTQVDTEDNQWTRGVAMAVGAAWQVKRRPRTNDYVATDVSGMTLSAGGYGQATYAGTKGRAAKQVVGGKFLVDHIENA
jgi:hypothetical protein